MSGFRPKDALKQAQAAEKNGQPRVASHYFAMLSIYLRRKGKYREARLLIEKAIALSPKSARLYLQLALCEVLSGNESAAAGAVELFSQNAIRRKKTEAYTPYLEIQLESYPNLRMIFYEAVVQTERTRAFPFLGIAKARLQQKKFSESLRALAGAWKTNDRRPEVLARFKELLKLQRHTAALQDLERVELEDMPFEDFELRWIGGGEPQKKAPPKKIERKSDDNPKTLKELISDLETELGFAIEEPVDTVTPLVREFRTRANSILAGDGLARIDMALAFYEMGLYRDARSELSLLAPEDPSFLQAQCLLGEVLMAEGSDLAAVEVFQACLRNQSLNVDQELHCEYHLARLLLKMGEPQRALDYIELIEKRDTNFREVRKMKAELLKNFDGLTKKKAS